MFARALTIGALLFAAAISLRAEQVAPLQPPSPPLAPDASGASVYEVACAACHGSDGKGMPRTVVGFAQELPDFTDCGFATPEPTADWFAVVHEGGPIRGLDRHMPAFGEALSADQIARVVGHVTSFCADVTWPRGDLNLPRSMFTEKAFPENEALLTASIDKRTREMGAEFIYERRLGKRNQFEFAVPFTGGGIDDVALAFKRTLHASPAGGRIFSAGTEFIVPRGIVEPFALFGQAIGSTGFFQAHAGVELPVDNAEGGREAYVRTAFGASVLADRGFGRAWTPMVEVLWARPQGAAAEWDVVPQMQVTLSKLQHVAVSGGVRIPVTQRRERGPEVAAYLLWDWFDGGFFEFWK